MEFRKINRWPYHHTRNIEIAIKVANGKKYQEVGREYDISRTRVAQIYRVACAKLVEQIFGIPWTEAVYNKEWYRHKEMKNILEQYKNFYEKLRS